MQIPFILSDELVIEDVRPIALRVADSSSARRPGHALRNPARSTASYNLLFADAVREQMGNMHLALPPRRGLQ